MLRSCAFVLVAGLTLPASAQLIALDPADPRVGDRRAGQASPGFDRGLFTWEGVLTMIDTLEGAPLGVFSTNQPALSFPDTVKGPPGFDWGPNTLLGQSAFGNDWASVVDLSNEPIGGDNASRGIRLRTAVQQNPGDFYLGARHRWPVLMGPDDTNAARVQADLYATSLAQVFTFEPADTVSTSTIATRVLWGGDCEEFDAGAFDCNAFALDGHLNAFVFLSDCVAGRCFGFRFWPGRFCADRYGDIVPGCTPPPFAGAGDVARPHIGAWFRLAYEFTPDFRKHHYVDYFDGTGEHLFGIDSWVFTPYFNQVSFSTSFEDADARLYVDNIIASGPGGRPLAQPERVCPYTDDVNWLAPGLLDGQIQTAWFAYSSGDPSVVQRFNGATGDYAIAIDPDKVAGTTIRRVVDAVAPENLQLTTSADIEIGVDIRHDNSRKRTVEIATGLYGSPYSTVTLGDAADPRIRVARPGGPVTFFDVAWPSDGEFHRLTIRVDAFRRVRLAIDGQPIGLAPDAFTSTTQPPVIGAIQFNAVLGGLFEFDNLSFQCDLPNCIADVNGDESIDFLDLNAVLSAFGATGEPGANPADLNGDGVVNFTDLNAVLVGFGTNCD
jgi:hypothetical protein